MKIDSKTKDVIDKLVAAMANDYGWFLDADEVAAVVSYICRLEGWPRECEPTNCRCMVVEKE